MKIFEFDFLLARELKGRGHFDLLKALIQDCREVPMTASEYQQFIYERGTETFTTMLADNWGPDRSIPPILDLES